MVLAWEAQEWVVASGGKDLQALQQCNREGDELPRAACAPMVWQWRHAMEVMVSSDGPTSRTMSRAHQALATVRRARSGEASAAAVTASE